MHEFLLGVATGGFATGWVLVLSQLVNITRNRQP